MIIWSSKTKNNTLKKGLDTKTQVSKTQSLVSHNWSSGILCCRSDGVEQPAPSSTEPDSQLWQLQNSTDDTSFKYHDTWRTTDPVL